MFNDQKRREQTDKFKKMNLDDKLDHLDGIACRPTRLNKRTEDAIEKIFDIVNDKAPEGLSKSDLKTVGDLVKSDLDID